ncbi:phage tail protein I [Candidatus Endobugula sertula]|uniref:Phage tail protein I n=1 Tax=Candidatus Endobugula sertula TaxID=62101 RepID=A0A1D2QS86_9GAMM|nr:phage tail protein I [Candidatus Endobugula sertula]
MNQLPILIDSLWDPSRCLSSLLPWLAWSTSGDVWFSNPNDPVNESIRRRELIRKNAFIHQHKGTKASIQSVLKAFADVSITLTEWWQQTPNGPPHTFRLNMLINGNTPGAGTAELDNKLRQAIDSVKPVRSHYSFSLSLVQTSYMRLAASSKVVNYKHFTMAAVING